MGMHLSLGSEWCLPGRAEDTCPHCNHRRGLALWVPGIFTSSNGRKVVPHQVEDSPSTGKEIKIPVSHETGQMAILSPMSKGVSLHSFCPLPSPTSMSSDLITVTQVVMAESTIQPIFVDVPDQVQGYQFLRKAP